MIPLATSGPGPGWLSLEAQSIDGLMTPFLLGMDQSQITMLHGIRRTLCAMSHGVLQSHASTTVWRLLAAQRAECVAAQRARAGPAFLATPAHASGALSLALLDGSDGCEGGVLRLLLDE